MNKKLIPNWLKRIVETTGEEQGGYRFGEGEVLLAGLPREYIGIAQSDDGGLAVAKSGDEVIYRFREGKVEVFAVDEAEFIREIRRDEAWEELVENMPVSRLLGLGIVITSKNEAGETMTLGFKGETRDSVMVIQGEMRPEEMLVDALERELKQSLAISDYEVTDVVDDGGEWEHDGEVLPLFRVVVVVPELDVSLIGDERIGWIKQKQKNKRIIN